MPKISNSNLDILLLDILTDYYAGNTEIAKKVLDAQKKPEVIQ